MLVMLISVSRSGDLSVLQSVPTCYGDHPNNSSMENEKFYPEENGDCHECNHSPEFSASLKLCRAIPPLRRAPSWRLQGRIYFYIWSPENYRYSA